MIGAGAVGASTAFHLAKKGVRVRVLEKESAPARHQSSRNSGVIHAGYNLKPGSNKAIYCVEGNRQLREYCAARGVPMIQGGILVVGRTEAELPVLAELKRRADLNGVQASLVDERQIRELEPHARGLQALHAPEGASFDSAAFVERLLSDASSHGAQLHYGARVTSLGDPSLRDRSLGQSPASEVRVTTSHDVFHSRVVVNCAGLHADRVAGPLAADVRVVPFRGYYAEIRPGRRHLIGSHLYSAPDLDFPFLGVHLSRQVDGRVLVGPGAMLAFGREAYRLRDVNLRDLGGILSWPGFHRLTTRPQFRKLIASEVKKSLSLRAIWREARQVLPDLDPSDLARSFAGNRAQLVTRDGELVDDILVRETERAVHVLNAVSPGLTCSLPFGKYVAGRAREKLG
ncbi:MAG: L-2-hydroxyglutarate oxidase [Gemmatimonadales bacterium]